MGRQIAPVGKQNFAGVKGLALIAQYTQIYVDCDTSPFKYDTSFVSETTHMGIQMAYNRTFNLSISDIDLIEEALRARGRELCTMRRALSDENPAHLESIKVIEADQRVGEELLGRLHDQKIFYRPKSKVYVSG